MASAIKRPSGRRGDNIWFTIFADCEICGEGAQRLEARVSCKVKILRGHEMDYDSLISDRDAVGELTSARSPGCYRTTSATESRCFYKASFYQKIVVQGTIALLHTQTFRHLFTHFTATQFFKKILAKRHSPRLNFFSQSSPGAVSRSPGSTVPELSEPLRDVVKLNRPTWSWHLNPSP